MIIYKVTNLVNQKIYIGQTVKDLEYRKGCHYREMKNPNRKRVYFHNALAKYKDSDFIWEVIAEANTKEELDKLEQYWVSYYNSNDPEKGYNLKAGGQLGGGVNSQSTKDKIGETTKIKWQNPEIAKKMMDGLRKGNETIKEMAKNNYKTVVCKKCGKEFTYRPMDTKGYKPKFCSNECMQLFFKTDCLANLEAAAKVNKEKYEIIDRENKEKIDNWCKEHIKEYKDIPMNKLTPIFKELSKITGLEDARSIMRIYGFTSKRKFVTELLKIYADQV